MSETERTLYVCDDCDMGLSWDTTETCDYCGGAVWKEEGGGQ